MKIGFTILPTKHTDEHRPRYTDVRAMAQRTERAGCYRAGREAANSC